ncbi:phospholipid-transporting ATPase ABCA3-like [Cloeon dipterum]|uniref:phospholipid-transporting ATPase ABCA3-like n=1 Tax=Cloeon dipterum TaxID=197152 RepID=UPI0032209750
MKGFYTEEELLMFNKTEQTIGLIFEGDAAASVNGQVPKKLDYKIRIQGQFQTETLIDIRSKCPNRYSDKVDGPYLSTGFLGVQMVTNKAFIELAQSQEEQKPPKNIHDKILLQKMPCPPNSYDQNPRSMLPFLCIFSFLILCVTVTKRIVEEKQTGAKELMTLMGMEKWTFWVGWFIDALLVKALTIAFIVSILKTPIEGQANLIETSPSLLFVMFFIYCASAIVFLFALSTFFSGPVFAMIVSLLVWMSPFAVSSERLTNSGFFTKCFYMLFPNMGLYFSFDSVVQLEENGVGAQWSNFYASQSAQDVSILQVFIMYLIDIVLYSIITWYVSEVNPGEYGYKQPYLFFATKSYWFGGTNKSENLTKVLRLVEDPDILSKENYERPLTNNMADERIGISVRNLTKSYPGKLGGPPVKAVRGVSLDIYKGEITALLGHNGAGKTTTMSILTGMISPSDGLVQVLGFDLKNSHSLLRKSVGMCPQHNLLFGELTVKQHLVFFAVLKGKSMKDAEIEAKELLRTFRLDSKMNALVSELSGGMKRKLQLAIALVGGSKVVILDEPTSGLDPEARREIWDILLRFRENKTILLSTHFMEEADVLGDTIAIMSHGRMECCGSTMYLKRLFGTGYRLNLLTTNSCDQNSLQNAVKNVLPEAIVEKSSQDTTDSANRGPITFTLPTEKVDQFPRLFDVLETLKDDLGISSIGVSITTMKDVFLKVGDLSAIKYDNKSLSDFDITDRGMETPLITQTIKLTGISLFFEQFRALLVKKVIFSKKNWFLLLLQVDELQEKLIEIGTSSLRDYLLNYIVAANITSVNEALQVTGFFSFSSAHSAPISLNLMSNALLNYHLPSEYQISTENQPIPHKTESEERVLESRQLQMMTGCPAYLIWLSYFVIDALITSVVAILVLVVVYLVDTLHIFTSGPALESKCEMVHACYQPASYIWGDKDYKGFNWPVKTGGIGQELLYFLFGIVFWGTIVLILDSGVLSRIFEKVLTKVEQIRPTVEADSNPEDEDVREERERVENNFESPIGDSVLAVKSLQKRFGYPIGQKGRFPAVKGVSFRVERGECFGLLGVNGAGKSTTFKMLTGAVPPTNGNALLRQFTLKSDLRKFLSGIGYCPQTNAQLGVLTGRETLHLFARLRGMPRDQIKEVVNKWLVALGLMEYANRPAGTYSGGNQRKLSAGIALIGESPVVLLDEPTSGVDPAARRQLWQVLASCQKAGQSIVLTSHSMDECEALCSRLAIMVAGKLVCLGPIGHLKNKFGQGYTLMVKVQMAVSNNDDEATSLAVTQLSNLKNDIQMKFAPCELIDEHIGFLHYQLKGTGRKWAEMFKEMQSLKSMHTILEDYTLSETTLEQLFLSFAQQRDPVSC